MQEPDLPGSTVRYVIDDDDAKWISAEDLYEMLDMNRLNLEAEGLTVDSWDHELAHGLGAIVGYLGHLNDEIKYLVDDDVPADLPDDVPHGQEAA